MLYANQLLEKYGFNLPEEGGEITIFDFMREETVTSGLTVTEEETYRFQKAYWDEFNPEELANLRLGVIYQELQELEDLKNKSIKNHLLAQSQIPNSLNVLIPLNPDVLGRNVTVVNMNNLKNRKEDVENFTKDKFGDFTLTGELVLMEYGWASLPSKRRNPVKGFDIEAWHALTKVDVLRNIIRVLGQEVENESLVKDFIVVSRSLAEAIQSAYPLNYMKMPSVITVSEEEIYFTLKSDAVNQEGILPENTSCCQILETALALK